MLNVRKSTFFLGLWVVTNLLLLSSCSGGKKEAPKQELELEDPKNQLELEKGGLKQQLELEKEEQRLINEMAQKLNWTANQKENFNKKFQKAKQNATVKIADSAVCHAKIIQNKLSPLNEGAQIKNFGDSYLRSLGFSGDNFTGDKKVLQEAIDFESLLYVNLIAQIELRNQAKK